MLTIEALKALGVNTDEGLARCMNMEAFYLRLVGQCLADEEKMFDELKAGVESNDARRAFDAAHKLKGSTGNLSLTPIYDPICALTELLRGREGPVEDAERRLLDEVLSQLEKARALL